MKDQSHQKLLYKVQRVFVYPVLVPDLKLSHLCFRPYQEPKRHVLQPARILLSMGSSNSPKEIHFWLNRNVQLGDEILYSKSQSLLSSTFYLPECSRPFAFCLFGALPGNAQTLLLTLSQGSLLADLGENIGYWGSNLGQLHA